MGCSGCSCGTTSSGSSSSSTEKVGGCNSNGCSSGGCNRKNSYDWISALGIDDPTPYPYVEVSFKNGSRKEFFKNPNHTKAFTGDYVLVETPKGGYDLGKVSLSGELVRLQMKKRRVKNDTRLQTVIRKAHERDLERLNEVRNREKQTLVNSRAIARTLGLNMKIGDIEYQGDGKKVTIFYTADNRVDFRELIRLYHKEFQVKIEMRQIGARQESARIGGLGNCGRELCCSTWLSDFKSVNTAAARYQNLAINQIKLTGMCGRLKCCLNYELDAYIDALEEFPDKAERFKTSEGVAILVKTDVFKRLMFFTYENNRGKFYPLHIDQVWDVLDLIKSGKMPQSLAEIEALRPKEEPDEEVLDFENVHNVIELPFEEKKKRKKKKRKSGANLKSAVEEGGQNRPQNQQGGNQQRQGADRPTRSNDQRGPSSQQPRQERPANTGNRPPQHARPDRPPRTEGPRPDRPPRTEGPRPDRPPRTEGPRPDRPPRTDGAARPDGPPRPDQQNRERREQQPRVDRPDGNETPPTQGNDQKPNNNRNQRNKNRFKGRGPSENKPPTDQNN
jgi:cell fate regulator YaaT (PSP1 superfamily)